MTKRSKSLARITSAQLAAIERGTFGRDVHWLHDGGGLYLRPNPVAGGGYWLFKQMVRGNRRKIGIGSFPKIAARDARDQAHSLRMNRRSDPVILAKVETAARVAAIGQTFDDEAALFIEAMRKADQHERTTANFERWLAEHCRKLGRMVIDAIETRHVAEAVEALMIESPSSGTRCAAFIKRVIAQAKAAGRADPNKVNPATKEMLMPLLGHYKKGGTRKHTALDWQAAPALCAKLAANETPRAQALLTAILSGLRTKEIYRARWDEFDLKAGIWRKPLDEMKVKEGDETAGHQVPISSGLAAVLERLRPSRNDTGWLFVGQSEGHIGESSMLNLLAVDMDIKATVHGFRSTVSDWGLEQGYSRDVMDAVLAHKVRGVRGSYQRTTFWKQRVEVMEAWSRYCLGEMPARLKLVS